MPANVGIQNILKIMDIGFHRDDGKGNSGLFAVPSNFIQHLFPKAGQRLLFPPKPF